MIGKYSYVVIMSDLLFWNYYTDYHKSINYDDYNSQFPLFYLWLYYVYVSSSGAHADIPRHKGDLKLDQVLSLKETLITK